MPDNVQTEFTAPVSAAKRAARIRPAQIVIDLPRGGAQAVVARMECVDVFEDGTYGGECEPPEWFQPLLTINPADHPMVASAIRRALAAETMASRARYYDAKVLELETMIEAATDVFNRHEKRRLELQASYDEAPEGDKKAKSLLLLNATKERWTEARALKTEYEEQLAALVVRRDTPDVSIK